MQWVQTDSALEFNTHKYQLQVRLNHSRGVFIQFYMYGKSEMIKK